MVHPDVGLTALSGPRRRPVGLPERDFDHLGSESHLHFSGPHLLLHIRRPRVERGLVVLNAGLDAGATCSNQQHNGEYGKQKCFHKRRFCFAGQHGDPDNDRLNRSVFNPRNIP